MPPAATCNIWLPEDPLPLLRVLKARDLGRLLSASSGCRRQFQEPVAALRRAEADPDSGALEALDLQQALQSLELALSEAGQAAGKAPGDDEWGAAWQELASLEATLRTDMRYVYAPDWEIKPGKLVSRKGTWLKTTAQFSWELKEGGEEAEKLYLPAGVAVPVLQIGRVVDKEELKLHDWVIQHLRVWMKPEIVKTIKARHGGWFIYWPHFEDRGLTITPAVDTWLKRSCQMSGELQPFELIYAPRGVPINLAQRPASVDEDWEKARHQHVSSHRRVVLASPPVTMKQDQYDILVGQRDGPTLVKLKPSED
mmetsp:Transcript_47495/g.106636  ORF Transcript_47495/g.106636 Transcript_47495/m.106636 type:complete len:312 (-) Transcript_47495:95-1030(-)